MPLYQSKVYGIVQGVGFRPFVDRLATRFNICGSVCNKGPYVEIFAAGTDANLQSFFKALITEAPERSSILKLDKTLVADRQQFTKFSIIESAKEQGNIFVSPDIATCDKCRSELFDPNNRRYLHPFINCTACGPRLTILDSMPYDRERTSMGEFPMCTACHREYTNPDSRRYDAQPVCCNDCGPEVYIIDDKKTAGAAAITKTRQIIASGGIAAIKGIGGFHLCCDAYNQNAISRLRKLKHRPVKPFAIMCRDIETISQECHIESGQEAMLTGHQKPIVLLAKKAESQLAELLAPGNPKLGVMLPYAPVQMLLFDYPDGIVMPKALVMTSGNPAGAPICRDDNDASESLQDFTDIMLSHNRKIRIRADDTVMDWLNGAPYMIRRSRGFAPLPFMLKNNWQGQVLGIGGELKNTFCLGKDNLFYPSPYIGDMSDLRTVKALKETITRLSSLLEITPAIVACDLHPRYNTTTIASELNLPVLKVQHHYAHILACMAENDYDAPVIGLALDGTGYGTDGTVWGGEILQADFDSFTRLGYIHPFKQAGGDKASTEGWRIAVAMIYDSTGHDKKKTCSIITKLKLCSPAELTAQLFMLDNNINSVTSTSAGRLFDAVSAILGIKTKATFEGEASMYLEFAAEKWQNENADTAITKAINQPALNINETAIELATDKLFAWLLQKRLQGQSSAELAYLFHLSLADYLLNASLAARKRTGLNTIALSGGVFQNHLLMILTEQKLAACGFTVLKHQLIPPNDGGIALGQAVAAMQYLNKQS